MSAGAEAALWLLRDEMAGVRRQLAEALGALRDLYDEQNGPPLITDADRWSEAMERARAVLEAHDA